jgi:hypothetical protein
MLEQRLSVRLITMWDKLAELNPPPMYSHLNHGVISDIWAQCAVIRVEQTGADVSDPTFAFDYIGDKSRALLPNLSEGKMFRLNGLSREVKKFLEDVPNVMRNVSTIVTSGTLAGGMRNKLIKYRICLLPFTNNSGAVSHIMVGFSWIEC